MARNSLLPQVRDAIAALITEGDGTITVRAVRKWFRDPDRYDQLIQAVDLKQAKDLLLGGAIRSALAPWPAYKDGGRFVHVDPEQEHSAEVWDRVLALRREQRDDLEHSIEDLTSRRDAAKLREQLSEGVPVAEPEAVPESVES